MLRTLLRAALIAALITGGSFFGAQAPASARTNDTGCNANNPRGGGCPGNLGRLGRQGSPVCGRGRHVGNPHCRPAAGGTTNPPGPRPNVRSSGTRVRSVAARTTPRANRAVAPRRNKAVSTRAAKAL